MNSIVPEHYFNLLCVICLGEVHFSSFTLPRQVRYRGLQNKETENKILIRERLTLGVQEFGALDMVCIKPDNGNVSLQSGSSSAGQEILLISWNAIVRQSPPLGHILLQSNPAPFCRVLTVVGVILRNIQWAMKVKLEVITNVKRSVVILHWAIGMTHLMNCLKLPKFKF